MTRSRESPPPQGDPASTAYAGRCDLTPAPGDRQLVRERVLDAVRAAISGGRLAPGTRLTERQLCADYQISRTLAREVVRQLESERLIDVVAHRGLRIARLSRKRVREIYAIRTELEVLVVRSFIDAAADADVDTLAAIFADLRLAGDAGDLDRIVTEVTRFLWHMIAVADNQIAGEILRQLLARINMLRVMSMTMPGQIETSMVQIALIVDRIAARDAEGAEQAVRVYIDAAGQSALKYLDNPSHHHVARTPDAEKNHDR